MDEDIVLRKSEKKKHKKNKDKEVLSSSEVPMEKKKHKKSKDKEVLSSPEVPTEKKKHKKHKEKEASSSLEAPAEKKKHKKRNEKEASSSSELPEEKVEGSREKEGVSDINRREESGKRKKKKDKEKVKVCSDVGVEENDEHVKKRKGKKNKRNNENGDDFGVSCIEKSDGEAQSGSRSSKKRHREEEVVDVETGEGKKKSKKKKKRTKLDANIENAEAGIEDVEREHIFGSTNENLGNSDFEKSSKRVKFASHVEVFPSSDDKDGRKENPGIQMIKGKRFTKEEDQKIKDAVYNYIEAHQLGEAGLEMVLDARRHSNLRYCWREIGLALPYRTTHAVSQRGHTLFTRDESHTWTEDDKTFTLQYIEKHPNDWKGLADILGKNRFHVHDTWRRICRPGLRKGKWNQAEYQSLFDSVNKDLRMRMYEEKYSKHGMIKDNISWNAVGNCLGTRTDMSCCQKWYKQLSPMVKKELWAEVDDYKLLDELLKLDACCIKDVDWDNLLEHRPGDICLERWRQMVNHIGQHGLQSFAEQVEVLAKRYCPELLEVREALDGKPSVD